MWQEKEITGKEKWQAIGTLLLEIAFLVFVIIMFWLLLDLLFNLVAHVFFGYSWTWLGAHVGYWLFFLVLIATPLILLGGLIWIALRDEYRRILRTRMRKW